MNGVKSLSSRAFIDEKRNTRQDSGYQVSGSITKASIEKVKESTDIVELIGSYVPLKKAGVNFVGLCPFHNEKTPSFNVSPTRQMFHCFGCQKGGDALGFLIDHEGIGFTEAVEKLAQRSGIELEYEKGKGFAQPQNRSEKDRIFNINERVADWWQSLLENDGTAHNAREYLAQRKISSAAQKIFRIGYSPQSWEELIHWGKSKGYDIPSLLNAGLIKKHEESGRFYSRFRGRLMFPICDLQGRIIGFSGRILNNEEKGAKYINSPETILFKKSHVLFGIDKARKPILDEGFCIVCEGQLDTISLHQAGIKNVIAPQGTAFGEGHIAMIKKLTSGVVLCFDSDEAGQKAAAKVWKELFQNEMDASVILLPDGHDPDSYIKENGIEAFEGLIQNKLSYIDFLIRHWIVGLDLRSAIGKQTIAKQMGEVAIACKNPIMANEIARKTALAIGEKTDLVKETWSRYDFKTAKTPQHKKIEDSQNDSETTEDIQNSGKEDFDLSQLPKNEFELIRILIKCSDQTLRTKWNNLVNDDWIIHPVSQMVIESWRSMDVEMESHPSGSPNENAERQFVESFIHSMKDIGLESMCRAILLSDEPIPRPNEQVEHLLTKLRNKYLDSRILQLNEEASDPNINDEQIGIVLRLQQELRDEKRTPITESSNSEADYF